MGTQRKFRHFFKRNIWWMLWLIGVSCLAFLYWYQSQPLSAFIQSPLFYLESLLILGLAQRKHWSFQFVKGVLWCLAVAGLLLTLALGGAGLNFYLDFQTGGILRDQHYMRKMFYFGLVTGGLNLVEWILYWIWGQFEGAFPYESRILNQSVRLFQGMQSFIKAKHHHPFKR